VVPTTDHNPVVEGLQLGSTANLYGRNDAETTTLTSNSYLSLAGYPKYITTNEASEYIQTSGNHIWYNAPSGTAGAACTQTERMRIDSSGNLLVGTTDNTLYDNTTGGGFKAGGDDRTDMARQADIVATMNRTGNSDGTILEFRKDGAPVGSIGANSGYMYLGSGDTGLYFNSLTNQVYPVSATGGGSNEDGTQDLGRTTARFKDLFLSGGVYLGGTGADNKLDDYEEGTFTPSFGGAGGNPTVTFDVNEGYYRKVGDLVFVQGRMTLSSASGGSGSLEIDGLPFTPVADAVISVTRLQNLSIDISASGPIGILAASLFVYYNSNTTGNHTVLTTSALTNTTSINFSGCYAV
jgi:hypothetical protein